MLGKTKFMTSIEQLLPQIFEDLDPENPNSISGWPWETDAECDDQPVLGIDKIMVAYASIFGRNRSRKQCTLNGRFIAQSPVRLARLAVAVVEERKQALHMKGWKEDHCENYALYELHIPEDRYRRVKERSKRT